MQTLQGSRSSRTGRLCLHAQVICDNNSKPLSLRSPLGAAACLVASIRGRTPKTTTRKKDKSSGESFVSEEPTPQIRLHCASGILREAEAAWRTRNAGPKATVIGGQSSTGAYLHAGGPLSGCGAKGGLALPSSAVPCSPLLSSAGFCLAVLWAFFVLTSHLCVSRHAFTAENLVLDWCLRGAGMFLCTIPTGDDDCNIRQEAKRGA